MTFGARFLAAPDLFPRRLSGEAWGGASLHVEIAGMVLALSGLSDSQASACAERYRELLLPQPSVAPDVRVGVFRAPASDFLDFDLRGWQTTFDFDHRASGIAWAGRRTMGRLERDTGGGSRAALWTSVEDAGEFPPVLENVLRVVVAHLAAARGGALLHSAGVLAGDRAFLFVGHSGAGKSTLCGLSREAGHRVLSDELNLLMPRGETADLFQLPFAGDFGGVELERRPFELAGIYLLRQGPEARVAPVTAARAVAALTAASPFVNGDPAGLDPLLARIERIVRIAPVHELTFRLDPDFWSILLPGR